MNNKLLAIKTHSSPDFSDYLKMYLEENYPESSRDTGNIADRNQQANAKFQEIFDQTKDYDLAYENAMLKALEGILFSKIEFIRDIILLRFADAIGKREIDNFYNQILPECESIFLKYKLTDDMMYGSQNAALKQEIIAYINSYLLQED